MNDFSLSVVIPTYNRYNSLTNLVNQINELCGNAVIEIIVIDSTDMGFREIVLTNVKQIISPHKNALFQRYLGWKAAKSLWLLFLDDDMEIIDENCLLFLGRLTRTKSDIHGFGLAFTNKHNNSVINNLPKSVTSKVSSKLFLTRILRKITGYPELPQGSYYYCGIRGSQPITGGYTEWFSGGAFLARKESLFENFNLQMCDLFEEGLGMGEDVLLGYTLSKIGKIEYVNEVMFSHNDQGNSRFTANLMGYGRRVFYSRLYLSLEYARLNGLKLYKAYLYYNWYAFFRIVGMILNLLIGPNRSRARLIGGSFSGWLKSYSLRYDTTLTRNYCWSQRADQILKRYSV